VVVRVRRRVLGGGLEGNGIVVVVAKVGVGLGDVCIELVLRFASPCCWNVLCSKCLLLKPQSLQSELRHSQCQSSDYLVGEELMLVFDKGVSSTSALSNFPFRQP